MGKITTHMIKSLRLNRNRLSKTIFNDSDPHITCSSLYFIIDIVLNLQS